MSVFVTHQSALAYWLGPYVERKDILGPMSSLPPEAPLESELDAEYLQRLGFSVDPLHVSVPDPGRRMRRRGVAAHVMSGPIPEGAFERRRGSTWVSSPEQAYCQVARDLSFAELVKLGYELCATFRINEFTGETDRREPLVTAARLRSWAAGFQGPGAKSARAAAHYVCGNTESPMEIALAMLLTLPKMYGGYGLPAAEPNREIRVVTRGGKRTENIYRGDLVWPAHRVIVEYDSDLHHRAPRKLSEDAVRRNNLQDAGWRVITVTWDQARSSSGLDTVAAQIAHALGVHNPYVPVHAAERRIALRKLLLPWVFPGFEGF